MFNISLFLTYPITNRQQLCAPKKPFLHTKTTFCAIYIVKRKKHLICAKNTVFAQNHMFLRKKNPLHTIWILPHTLHLSHALTCRHTYSHSLTPTFTIPYTPTHPHTPSHTFTHLHTPSHTPTHMYTHWLTPWDTMTHVFLYIVWILKHWRVSGCAQVLSTNQALFCHLPDLDIECTSVFLCLYNNLYPWSQTASLHHQLCVSPMHQLKTCLHSLQWVQGMTGMDCDHHFWHCSALQHYWKILGTFVPDAENNTFCAKSAGSAQKTCFCAKTSDCAQRRMSECKNIDSAQNHMSLTVSVQTVWLLFLSACGMSHSLTHQSSLFSHRMMTNSSLYTTTLHAPWCAQLTAHITCAMTALTLTLTGAPMVSGASCPITRCTISCAVLVVTTSHGHLVHKWSIIWHIEKSRSSFILTHLFSKWVTQA